MIKNSSTYIIGIRAFDWYAEIGDNLNSVMTADARYLLRQLSFVFGIMDGKEKAERPHS